MITEIRKDYEILLEHIAKSGDKGRLTELMEKSGIEFVSSTERLGETS